MSEKKSWTSSVGQWNGIPIRVHFLLILFCVFIVALELNSSQTGFSVFAGTGFVTVGLLLASLLIHEFAHIVTAINVGGRIRKIVLMPWGGETEFELPESQKHQAMVFAAGPFVNGLLFLMGAYLLVSSGHVSFSRLMNPFQPFEFDSSEIQISLYKIGTWLNFQIFLVNLIPSFPFDGARILRCGLKSMVGGSSTFRVESAVMALGNGVALAMIGLAIFVHDIGWGVANCGWIILLSGGITLIFCTRASFEQQSIEAPDEDESDFEPYYSERRQKEFSSFDYSDNAENSIYSNWLKEKQEERIQEMLQNEEADEVRADSILEKLHLKGISSLSEEERLVLNRVSARLRQQRQQGV